MATKASVAHADAARVRAEATFRKQEWARDAANAMTEYQDNARLVQEKTARLRALRLAREAAEAAAGSAKAPASPRRAGAGRRRAAS